MSTDPEQPPASILVVDDTAANLQLLTSMLKRRGYRVRPVTSGEMALRAIETLAPDLILLDITMPGMNGYEVCRRLKADERWRDIPVVFLSALTDTEDKIKAFQAGGIDYVGKPFQFEEVDARVRTHLELRRQRLELERSYARLTELERLRDSLTHMIAHDMRSPLFALQGSISLLRNAIQPDDADSLNLVDTALLCAERLSEMIAQMLDISRMEAGKMELFWDRGDVARLARQVVGSLKPLFAERTVEVEAPPSVWIDCDIKLIRRVIANLIGNALKFTSVQGRITVTVATEDPMVRVSVRDDGFGIAPENQLLIFDKFGQVGPEAKVRGFGLGLAFSKMAVEAHGGQIGVESAVGQGSTFWFLLPATRRPT